MVQVMKQRPFDINISLPHISHRIVGRQAVMFAPVLGVMAE